MIIKKKVLIVDDSRTAREILAQIINGFNDFEVIGKASDPFEAHSIMKRQMPDIITLDIEMPKMDGLTFLDKIMRGVPLPVVMISSLTKENAAYTLKALELGAVDYILKPDNESSLAEVSEIIHDKLLAAALVPRSWLNLHKHRQKDESLTTLSRQTIKLVPLDETVRLNPMTSVIFLGASTGGTIVIEKLLSGLDYRIMPPIMIVQHIPPFFSKSFADRLDKLYPFNVFEAESSHPLKSGDVIVAKGGYHLMIQKTQEGFKTLVKKGPKVNRHQPSVDVLFKSAAAVVRSNAVGVIMTGMGCDGASGLEEMKKNGAITIAQDRYECAVSGMPRSAIEKGVVDKEFDIKRMTEYLNALYS